jgi:hypothetical protein
MTIDGAIESSEVVAIDKIAHNKISYRFPLDH